MKDNRLEDSITGYFQLLDQQKFVVEELDYSAFELQKPVLRNLAAISNSGVSVFDLCKKEHVFYSPNFGVALGYDLQQIDGSSNVFFDAKIHPDDYLALMRNGVSVLRLFYQFTPDEKANYKLINEYRILNAQNRYVRVIEQQQVLAMDNHGNYWLALSIIDISPNQKSDQQFKCQLLNFRTGKIVPFPLQPEDIDIQHAVLSPRELQVLSLVRDGMLSKEISNELSISVKTVNTHRQRILEKLGANNSMEAVMLASRLGLLF
jgi:DNA-binding CsgD family transcriptional regulator